MRKLYALFTGILISLFVTKSNALPVTPDVANFTFTIVHDTRTVVFTNTSTIGSEPGVRRAFWSFGDGTGTWTGPLQGTQHQYQSPGTYNVCLRLFRIRTTAGDTVLSNIICKTIVINTVCRADFERLPPSTANNPLVVTYKALPWHNNGNRPVKICWRFGDGSDTCITYTNSTAGPYTVTHRYNHPGNYAVCVDILYHGGCEARKCKHIDVGPHQAACTVRLFEITPSITSLVRGFLAIPHSNTTPPALPYQVCWYFGDGTDTCITFTSAPPPSNFLMRHTYPAPGNYRACVKVFFNGGCIAQDCREVVIRNTSNVCGGYMTDSMMGPRTFKFKGYGIHPPNDQVLSYRWSFGDGATAFGQEATHTYTHGGDYNVCLLMRTRLGCETRICKTVRVPGQNTPQLHLSPNPVINVMNVMFFSTHTETINIRILNNSGTVVRNFTRNVTTGANNWSHDLSNLLPGLYSYVVQSPNQLASAMFIKQ